MLVLTRKFGQKIMIGDVVEVVIFPANNRDEVNIGINAPRELKILRNELYERNQQRDLEKIKKAIDAGARSINGIKS